VIVRGSSSSSSLWFLVADLVIYGSFVVRFRVSVDLDCWLWFVVRSYGRLALVIVVVTAVMISVLRSKLGMLISMLQLEGGYLSRNMISISIRISLYFGFFYFGFLFWFSFLF